MSGDRLGRPLILDIFAGPGGWSEALRALGHTEVGIEWDAATCATRAAAGHTTIRANVADLPLAPLIGKVSGLIASPPCPSFSNAGKRLGISDMPRIIEHAHACIAGWSDYDPPPAWHDDRSPLILEVLRYALTLSGPTWIACEQVPPALPVWEAFAHCLRAHGWYTWCGILNAADYGVPQTRERAFLLAHRKFVPQPPHPTHARTPHPTLFGEPLRPWVSMADALGWGAAEAFGNGARASLTRERERTVALRYPRGSGMDERHGARRDRSIDEPAPVIRSKARSATWVVQTGNNSHVTSREGSRAGEGGVELYERPVTEPAPTLDTMSGSRWRVLLDRRQTGAPVLDTSEVPAPTVTAAALSKRIWQALVEDGVWPEDRPATTIAGDPRVFPPGGHIANDGRDNSRMVGRAQHTIPLTVRDALILQSFRPDYPVQGSKSKQFEQIGNAVPPLLGFHVLQELIR